jgi:Ca2+-binding RTX toxin-like protein
VIGVSALVGIEQITGNGFANVTVLGSGSGNTLNFSAITLTGIVSIDGGGGSDTLTGTPVADVILGGAGNDGISGGAGDDTITGGAGNDTMNGDAGLDTFVFAAGFGADSIAGFDANPAGGQDLLDIRPFGITAATFAANVTIALTGGISTLVTIGGNTFIVVNVLPAALTIADFIVAP